MSETDTNAHKSLASMAEEVMAWARSKGWEPNPSQTFGDKMALLHSEVSEALEAYRDWGTDDATNAADWMGRNGGESPHKPPKPEGVGSEFADVLIRLLHTCANYDIDLQAEYERKMAYNHHRAWQHGGRSM